MKRENKVISLELAKKLHELGVRAESEWWWNDLDQIQLKSFYADGRTLKYPAYDTAELGEMLPKEIIKEEQLLRLSYGYGTRIEYTTEAWGYSEAGLTEAEARGKCLTWLIENGYIKVGE